MRFLLASFALLFCIEFAMADRTVISPPEGENWQTNAESFLEVYKHVEKVGGGYQYSKLEKRRPFSRSKDIHLLRCVKMNNYGCLWQRTGDERYPRNWSGTPGPSGENGAHDGAGTGNGHAVFEHPKWSIIAAYQWFERNTMGGKKNLTVLELAEIYAPWCDTIGSAGTKVGYTYGEEWGRTCQGGRKPPVEFNGPLCQKPALAAKPSREQCDSCNCPNKIAKYWLTGINELRDNKDLAKVGINDQLVLFDEKGYPSEVFKLLIKWKVGLETAVYMPNHDLFEAADEVFSPVSFEE
ncbi:hypothetical protein [Labrenzia sp. VG12]|uniref:hypothetical protein n=1 Tax=Labrenzia sp. VG12 TaxID=2021862 RepID=UPI0012FD7ED0|nr:hypothetical protein [Labrenzia sp. VG12]